jgi:uncharacterized sporulation protein YeaH/YhbH (DUF444 family)
MSLKIDQDHSRFRNIVRGKIRQNLRRYISQGEMIGRKGKDLVSIPIPQIDIPRFTFGEKQKGGVGQGDGEPGDPLSEGDEEGEGGQGKAGKDAGDHALEVDVTLDELADRLGQRPLHRHPHRRPREPAALPAHLPRGVEAVHRQRYLQPGGASDRAAARRQAVSLLERRDRARRQRRHHLHDGCFRIDG